MNASPLRARLIGLGVLLLFAAVFLFSFSRTKSGRALVDWVTGQVEVEEAHGRIVDATTGAGVPGATVVVSSFSGTYSPSIVGEVSHGADTTDADGRFVVPYQRIGNTRISARAAGYATIFRVKLGEGDVVLPTSPALAGEVIHHGEVGFDLPDTATQVFFDLESDSIVADAASADLAFAVDMANVEHVMMRALGQAGLAADAPPAATHPIDPLAASCTAPEAPDLRGSLLAGKSSTTTWFARLHDGARYCRLKVRVYGRGPTSAEGYRVEIERWLNTKGGRNVCLVPLEEEQSEFAPAERAARVAR